MATLSQISCVLFSTARIVRSYKLGTYLTCLENGPVQKIALADETCIIFRMLLIQILKMFKLKLYNLTISLLAFVNNQGFAYLSEVGARGLLNLGRKAF